MSVIEWLRQTAEIGVWVFIGLCVWTAGFFAVQWIRKSLHKIGGNGKSAEVHSNRMIYNELAAIRALSRADRVYVVRFHNGSEFLPSHPVWKMSRTHELVANQGISYMSKCQQNLLVSLVPEIITAVITGNAGERGTSLIERTDGRIGDENRRKNHHVVLFNIDDMDESYTKTYLKEQNIKQMMVFGIEENSNVIGYIGLDFSGEEKGEEAYKDILELVRESCLKIKYILNKNAH